MVSTHVLLLIRVMWRVDHCLCHMLLLMSVTGMVVGLLFYLSGVVD
jgi:hypothetical protein